MLSDNLAGIDRNTASVKVELSFNLTWSFVNSVFVSLKSISYRRNQKCGH